MLTLMKLEVEGFCSIIEPMSLPLNQNQTIIVRGVNGMGKSTLFSSLVWGLYGKNLKGISSVNTWKRYQTQDYKGTKVEVFFQNGDTVYKVIRCLNYKNVIEDGAKGGSRLLLYADGNPVDIKGKTSIQSEIVKAVGLSYNLFINSIMFGQGMKRLIQETNSDKKSLFEEAFGLEFINMAKEIALEEKKNLENKLHLQKSDLSALESKFENARELYHQLKDQEDNFEHDLEKERIKLKEKRSNLTKELLELKKDYKEDVKASLPIKLKMREAIVSNLKSKIKEAKAVSNLPLPELIDNILGLLDSKQYTKAKKKLTEIKTLLSSLDQYYEELDEAQEKLDSIKAIKLKYDNLNSKADAISHRIVDTDQELKALDKKKPKNNSEEYLAKAKKYRRKLKVLSKVFETDETTLKDYTWLLDDPLGNRGIKAYLFDSCLDRLNEILESYSEVLGFRIEFSIDLNTARKDFITLIERDNQIIEYDELSGGEKQTANIAMAFAMNEMVTDSKGVNLAFLDEVFESLSSDNIELVVSLIKHVFQGKTLFLITHHESLPLSNVKTLQVEKVNGVSTYNVL